MKQAIILLLMLVSVDAMAQNVGIGTSNPTRAKLEVYGTAAGSATSAIFGADGYGISLQRNWPTIGFNQYNSAGVAKYLSNGYGAALFLDPNNGGLYIDLYGNGSANGNVVGSKRALNIFSSGDIGVGNVADYATLNVARGTATDGTALFQGTTYHSQFNYSTAENTYIRGGKSSSNVYINDKADGNVLIGLNFGHMKLGINSTNPTNTLEIVQDPSNYTPGDQVNNMAIAMFRPAYQGQPETSWGFKIFNVPGGNWLGFFKDRYVQAGMRSDGSFYTYSDKRFKRNIQSIGSVLNNVLKLNAVNYYSIYDTDNLNKSLGFLAQDVQQLFPELVGQLSQGDEPKLALNYAGFGVLAIKAIQEQQTVISDQQKEIADLKSRLDDVEKLLQSMKQ